MTTKELINQYVTAHADNRWMDASELEALLTEFAEKLMANQPKTREALFREYLQATPAGRRKFDLSFLDETRKEALAILTDLGYECRLPQESASEDFESEWSRYCDSKGQGVVTMNVKNVAKHFAQWQREQMINNAIDATIDIIYTPTTWLPDIVYDTDKLKDLCKDKFEQGDRVRVIIIKE